MSLEAIMLFMRKVDKFCIVIVRSSWELCNVNFLFLSLLNQSGLSLLKLNYESELNTSSLGIFAYSKNHKVYPCICILVTCRKIWVVPWYSYSREIFTPILPLLIYVSLTIKERLTWSGSKWHNPELARQYLT